MGGQIPNNIAMPLHRQGANILGTSPDVIDGAEIASCFLVCIRLGVDQPEWKELGYIEDSKAFCSSGGYPVLVGLGCVLSGAAMSVVHKAAADLEAYISEATEVSPDCPVVISNFILEAKEIGMDAVARKGEVVMRIVSEHVENAVVHSGDATNVLPPQDLDNVTFAKVEEAKSMVANALNVTGPMTIQFIAKNNEIKVIECNLRTSRLFPFVSKTLGLELARVATKVMLDRPVRPYPVDVKDIAHVGVKVSQFFFTCLLGADPILEVEMASTGEVACFGSTREGAYFKGLLATNVPEPKRSVCMSIGTYMEKVEFLSSASSLVAQLKTSSFSLLLVRRISCPNTKSAPPECFLGRFLSSRKSPHTGVTQTDSSKLAQFAGRDRPYRMETFTVGERRRWGRMLVGNTELFLFEERQL